MKKHVIALLGFVLFVGGCCKDKAQDICVQNSYSLEPATERRSIFQCNSSNEYTYVFTNKEQIDSLQPACFFVGPVPFPAEETNMVYFMVGRMSYYLKDTFSFTALQKDTCQRKLTYEINMVQRDTILLSNGGGIRSIFCSVENIPADYEVEVKYKYVPIE